MGGTLLYLLYRAVCIQWPQTSDKYLLDWQHYVPALLIILPSSTSQPAHLKVYARKSPKNQKTKDFLLQKQSNQKPKIPNEKTLSTVMCVASTTLPVFVREHRVFITSTQSNSLDSSPPSTTIRTTSTVCLSVVVSWYRWVDRVALLDVVGAGLTILSSSPRACRSTD